MMALPRIGERYVMIVSLIALSKLSPPPSNSPIQIAIYQQRFTKKDDQQPFTVCMEMQKFSPHPPRRNGQNVPNRGVLHCSGCNLAPKIPADLIAHECSNNLSLLFRMPSLMDAGKVQQYNLVVSYLDRVGLENSLESVYLLTSVEATMNVEGQPFLHTCPDSIPPEPTASW